jgi:Zn-dependent M28 family amino/carboxypeptidase
MAAWLDSMARARADSVIVQRWTHVTAKGDTLPLQNVIARYNPAAEQRILFLAHWDTRPRADGPRSTDSSVAVTGANDGASGVALLLGVMDVLKRSPPPPSLGVDILFTDGEDYGEFAEPYTDVLIGARHYAGNQAPGPKPLYGVLFDLVADKDLQIYQEGNSVTGAPEVVSRVWETARDLGYGRVFVDTPKHVLTDDHIELQKAGIRAIDVVDFDYPAHHTPFDTIDKVSAASLQIVGDVALALVRRESR